MNNEINGINLDNLDFAPSQELINMVNDANQSMIKAEQSKQYALNLANQIQNTSPVIDSVNTTMSFGNTPIMGNTTIDSLSLSAGAGAIDPTLGAVVATDFMTTTSSLPIAGVEKIDSTPGAIVADKVASPYVPTSAGVEKIDPTPGAVGSGMISIPGSVNQTGITKNYTNYSYFLGKWNKGTAQRKVSEDWAAAGKTSDRGIATLNGRYLVAVSPKFGSVGQNVDICLENGQVIPATIADSKGSDAQSEWGHKLGKGIDVIEWESSGSKDNIDISGWQGVKVSGIKRV